MASLSGPHCTRGRISKDGTFELLVPFSGPVLVVPAATGKAQISGQVLTSFQHGRPQFVPDGQLLPWLQPGTTRVQSVVGAEVQTGPIVLSTTAMVSGKVLWVDGNAVSGADVRTSAADLGGRSLHMFGRDFLWWPDDSVTRSGDRCRSRADGSFELVAPRDKPSRLWLAWAPDTTVLLDVARTVRAPCIADLVLEGAILDIRVEHRGKPADVDVRIETDRAGTTERRSTPAPRGRMRLVLEPGRSYRIELISVGRKPQRFSYRAAQGGQERRLVHLDDPVGGTLTLRLEADPAPGGLRALFRSLDDEAGEPLQHEVRGRNGAYCFEGLAPGRYRVTLRRPQQPWYVGDAFLLETSAEVEVLAARDSEQRVPCTLGGRLRIRATDGAGLFVAATCTLLGPDGELQRPAFRVGAGTRFVRTAPGEILARGEHETEKNLPAGSYVVTIKSANAVAQRLPARIEPGEVSTLEVRF